MNGLSIGSWRQTFEIIKPFEDAFIIMKAILFQPFDFTKWLVIGFAAFIAGHFTAGGGFSPPTNFQPRSMPGYRSDATGFDFHHNAPWITFLIIGAVFFCVFVLVLMWIRARGIFVFTDCIVRNRAAIKEPWREYRREGNSLFLFLLGLAAVLRYRGNHWGRHRFLVAALGHFSKRAK